MTTATDTAAAIMFTLPGARNVALRTALLSALNDYGAGRYRSGITLADAMRARASKPHTAQDQVALDAIFASV